MPPKLEYFCKTNISIVYTLWRTETYVISNMEPVHLLIGRMLTADTGPYRKA